MPSLVSHKHRFIFVHIPKSGGTSIAKALGPYEDHARLKWFWRRAVPRLLTPRQRTRFRVRFHLTHRRASEMASHIADYDRLFSFGIVRNPWDRHVSLYEYLRQTPSRRLHKQVESLSFEEYLSAQREDRSGRQASWLCDESGNLIVDFVGRFERLEDDFAQVCEKVGVKGRLPHLNRSRRDTYRSYYTAATRDLVGRIDRRDIELFDYSF
jgi:hypothetical protein